MTERTVLSIDIGTSSVKAALLTDGGFVRAHTRVGLIGPTDHAADFPTERWWQALEEAIPPLTTGRRVDAVAISGNGPTVVAVDAAGEPVGPPLLWLDQRYDRTLDMQSFYLPRIRWFIDRVADAERVRWYLPFPEYIAFVLTGEPSAITPSDEFTPYIWSESEAVRAGVPAERLPPFVSVGEIIGRVRAEAGAALAIAPGTPVVAAGSDFLMSLVGTNTLTPGTTCDRAGTSEGINHCARRRVEDPGLRTLPHVIPGLYNVAGILTSTGLLFEWFRQISGQHGRDYGEMMREILDVGDDATIPWFFPSLHRGAAWEFRRGMFIGLGAEHDRAMMGRAVVLSIGFAVREAIEALAGADCSVKLLTSCGGQAKNAPWTQMKADITGVPIVVPEVVDAELAGNLVVALAALDDAPVRSVAADTIRFGSVIEPTADRVRILDEQYHHYRERQERFRRAMEECATD